MYVETPLHQSGHIPRAKKSIQIGIFNGLTVAFVTSGTWQFVHPRPGH